MRRSIVIMVAVMVWGGVVSAQTTNVWDENASPGNIRWNRDKNWVNDSVPVSGRTNNLIFGGSSPYSAENNFSTFLLHRLWFSNSSAASSVSIVGNGIEITNRPGFAGGIFQYGASAVFISNSLTLRADSALGGDGPGLVTLSGNMAGTNTLTKSGGSRFQLSSSNSFSGGLYLSGGELILAANAALGSVSQITIGQGTLLLGGTNGMNRVRDAAPVTLAGGTLNSGGFSEIFGALTLAADSMLDFGSGSSTVRFANSSSLTWSLDATLTLLNWTPGSDQLLFGTTGTGLTPGQLAQISFLNPGGFAPGHYSANLSDTGELRVGTYGFTPVPEMGTWLAPLTLAGWAAIGSWRSRRKRGSHPARLS